MASGFIKLEKTGGSIKLSGRLDGEGAGKIWEQARLAVSSGVSVVDCSAVDYMDGGGASLFMMMKVGCRDRNATLSINGLDPEFSKFLELFDVDKAAPSKISESGKTGLYGWISSVGESAQTVTKDMRAQVEFTGNCVFAFFDVASGRRRLRWPDFWLTAEKVGADGLPIILLIGFLMGLIMSFQSAVSLRRFGGEIFVPNMLGLVMFRELGPMVTAILLAGRTGSAFAAEIGTMKVNEELDALNTMGLNPVSFLVVPRVIATVFVTPLLTLFFNFMSLVGGALVMMSMGYPLATFCGRVFQNVQWMDFSGGMIKAVVFSFLVAGIGCQRGLVTKSGASAVGDSATSAVVSGIVLIAVFDGIFAVVFFMAGI
ncbi:ABC transporter permease [Desulfovibrio gilichinskyi]|uniref:Phospholipid/cholesterol/gamma-HCH transport system permease protein n=1 Tax=Desulfovibrio gilichinskyi TaxID=1519643 RepID=A0A1X7D4F2_9BACT|nr:MlaE family lipid ABC transporter permease subunit [Desulfovibrio gilichinskyi]SMF08684.1 phospholipid/cholesterol/gamma-HCH transport system permease protein [Desulfovibrio gilichinskyi]